MNTSPARTAPPSNPKGNLNIPLGKHLAEVEKHANKLGVSKTELGRMGILYVLKKLASGELTFRTPALAEKPEP